MDKCERISQFLDYGGNELFSSLMCEGVKHSEGIDRLVQLLCAYSDRCRFIHGRSAAYRFMIARAKLNRWLGPGSNDLKSHKLTAEDRERTEHQVSDYIKSGGAFARYAKKAAGCAGVLAVIALAFVMVYRMILARLDRNELLEYYNEQIIIEVKSATRGEIELSIHTTENAPKFMYLSSMPKLHYLTSGNDERYEIDEENEIVSSSDERADYTHAPELLRILGYDYLCSFEPGDYEAEFGFYYYDEEDNRIDLPKKVVKFSVLS